MHHRHGVGVRKNVIRVSRYHTIDETVRLWNGFIPSEEQFAPAGETEEEREQREQETYLHARFYKEEQRYNDSYNPKLKTQNFVYPSAADCKVDPARPTIMLNTGVDIISPPAPPKAKPAIMSFDTIKKRRRKRLADKTWIKDSILTQRDHVCKLVEFVEINPKKKDKLLDKYKSSFEKDQKKYDKLFEYESKKVVHTCRAQA